MSSRAPLCAIVVAGTHSGVGKTSVAIGLIGALRRRGLRVQGFKVGPDFIDPLHHQHASGRAPRNLDGWMLEPRVNLDRFARATDDADAAVIEGVMGLFDGSEGASERGSTAEMAKLLGLPVVLVVDAGAMARSAAAVIHGFTSFDPKLRVAGVILNNVGDEAHATMVADAVAGAVPILGALPRVGDLVMPERHLGLHLPHEARQDHDARLAALIEEHIDIDRLLAVGATPRRGPAALPPPLPPGARIALARDEAFCFYYADNLELLERAGAELVEFSPLREPLPDGVDGLYVGGGYPELHHDALSANATAIGGVRALAAAGAPIYAECGGLMYLARTLELDGISVPMCGVLPFATRMPASMALAYVEVTTTGGLFGTGVVARGHVFHRSAIAGEPATARCYRLVTSRGGAPEAEGYQVAGTLASYAHLHFAGAPRLAEAFVARALQFRRARGASAGAPSSTYPPAR